MATYQRLEDIASKHYSIEDQQIISVLSQQQVSRVISPITSVLNKTIANILFLFSYLSFFLFPLLLHRLH